MGICLYRGARAMPYGHDRHPHALHDRVAAVASTGAAYRSGVAADVAHGCGLWFCAQFQRLLQTSGNILPRMKDLPGLGSRIGRACSQIFCAVQSFTATRAAGASGLDKAAAAMFGSTTALSTISGLAYVCNHLVAEVRSRQPGQHAGCGVIGRVQLPVAVQTCKTAHIREVA